MTPTTTFAAWDGNLRGASVTGPTAAVGPAGARGRQRPPAWRPGGRLMVLAAALVLAGCGSLAPHYERPAAPVAATFPDDVGRPAAAGTQAVEIPWQQFFADERLKRLIGLALENNRDLRVAALNIERARALYRVQRADRLPTVNAALTGERAPGPTGDQTSTYTAGIAVSAYELDFFGRVKNLSDAALASYLATEEARQSAQIVLVASVATDYYALLADDELLALTDRTLATREDSARLAKLQFDNGVVSELDYRQATSLVESARATRAQLQRQRAADRNALQLLVGAAMPTDLPAPPRFAQASFGPELPAGLPSDLLANRPDIRQAEQQLLSANASIGAARAAFFPRITLTGSVGIASTQLSELFKGGESAWTFSPQLVLPIFDAGRNRANLAVAEADRHIAVANYEAAIQSAFREVADGLAGRATYGEQLRATEAQVAAEQARLNLSDLRYRSGVASYLDLLDAQRSLFAVQQSAVQVRLALLQNQVLLYQALGGGWQPLPAAGTATAGGPLPAAATPGQAAAPGQAATSTPAR